MEKEIIEKLKKELVNTASLDEKYVMYIMVELRKLLDRMGTKSKYNNLIRFYADWVLHVQMDRRPTQKLLSEFDVHVWDLDKTFSHEYYGFVSLGRLRDALYFFLKENNLPGKITDPASWHEFRLSLVKIISHCPLIGKNTLIKEYSYSLANDNGINYKIVLRDGKTKGGILVWL